VRNSFCHSNRSSSWVSIYSSPITETDKLGNLQAEYIYFGGKRVAMRKLNLNAYYYFADQIGSANIVTNATASSTVQDIEFHPYGEEKVYTDTLGQEYRFTGKEHDPEAGNDYFGARYYSSTLGRFLTPDWAATPVPIPYANPANPQTLNLYSYVENNPITGTDPDGHATDTELQLVSDAAVTSMLRWVGVRMVGAAAAVPAAGAIIGLEVKSLIDSTASINYSNAQVTMTAAAAENDHLLRTQAGTSSGDHNGSSSSTSTTEDEPAPQAASNGAGARQGNGGNSGTIYRVPGTGTSSGRPYIGRHNKPNPAKTRRSKDGRDRSMAEVVDTYNASDTQEGRVKEQQQIDKEGLQNLDNKRNEIKEDQN
jgi:RHS repeat-associated protein